LARARRKARAAPVEQAWRLRERTGRHVEPTIHLGCICIGAQTRATATTMIRGARVFTPLLRRFRAPAPNEIDLSSGLSRLQ